MTGRELAPFPLPLYDPNVRHADPLDNLRYRLMTDTDIYEPELIEAWSKTGVDSRFNLTPRQLLDPAICERLALDRGLRNSLLDYWWGMAKVERWQKGDQSIHPDGFQENNFRHTLDCVRIAKNLGVQYPRFQFVMRKAAEMLVFHDGSEGKMGGDVSRTNFRERALVDEQMKPIQELSALKSDILVGFPYESRQYLETIMQQYYLRDKYRNEGHTNFAAMMAKLIDEAQGTKVAIDRFYPNREKVGPHINLKIRRDRIVNSAQRLFKNIERVGDIILDPSHQQSPEMLRDWQGIVVYLLKPFQDDHSLDEVLRLPEGNNVRVLLST